ncbi:MAG: trypsin-like peptidase domain-containing protein [Chlamydiales bacterium]|nr:trypsin-like peptidase domain-containing protein [Chlamydiales bacterium]
MTSIFTIGKPERSPQVKFGDDSRVDLVNIESPVVRAQARAIACLMTSSELTESYDGVTRSYALSSSVQTLRQRAGVSKKEKFAEQPAPGFGTAFLVGNRYALTAGHCVDNPIGIENMKMVFDFSVKAEGVRRVFDESSVYGIKRVVAFVNNPGGADWALVKLDRAVTDITPLAVEFSRKISRGAKIHMLGHPTGLPLKYASGSEVKKKPKTTFTGDLDSFHGNSGSPVVNSKTNKVSGILIRGPESYSNDSFGKRRVLQGYVFPECQSTHKLGVARAYLQAVGAIDDLKGKRLAKVQSSIAKWYSKGSHHLPRNEAKAFKFYKKAADADYKRAQYKVAERLRSGVGVQKDKAEAVRWYKESAANNSIKALERLVEIYTDGQCGKSVDSEKAARYSEKIKQLEQQKQKTPAPSILQRSFEAGMQAGKGCVRYLTPAPFGELLS